MLPAGRPASGGNQPLLSAQQQLGEEGDEEEGEEDEEDEVNGYSGAAVSARN